MNLEPSNINIRTFEPEGFTDVKVKLRCAANEKLSLERVGNEHWFLLQALCLHRR